MFNESTKHEVKESYRAALEIKAREALASQIEYLRSKTKIKPDLTTEQMIKSIEGIMINCYSVGYIDGIGDNLSR